MWVQFDCDYSCLTFSRSGEELDAGRSRAGRRAEDTTETEPAGRFGRWVLVRWWWTGKDGSGGAWTDPGKWGYNWGTRLAGRRSHTWAFGKAGWTTSLLLQQKSTKTFAKPSNTHRGWLIIMNKKKEIWGQGFRRTVCCSYIYIHCSYTATKMNRPLQIIYAF